MGISTGNSAEVFVSHAAEDLEIANDVVENLEKRGVKCWIAPRDIALVPSPSDKSWAEIIEYGLRDCKALIVLVTPYSVSSTQVKREVQLADNYKLAVIPLDSGDSEMDGHFAYLLALSQKISLDNLDDSTYDRIARDLKTLPPKSQTKAEKQAPAMHHSSNVVGGTATTAKQSAENRLSGDSIRSGLTDNHHNKKSRRRTGGWFSIAFSGLAACTILGVVLLKDGVTETTDHSQTSVTICQQKPVDIASITDSDSVDLIGTSIQLKLGDSRVELCGGDGQILSTNLSTGDYLEVSCTEMASGGVGHYLSGGSNHLWYFVNTDTSNESAWLVQFGIYKNDNELSWHVSNLSCFNHLQSNDEQTITATTDNIDECTGPSVSLNKEQKSGELDILSNSLQVELGSAQVEICGGAGYVTSKITTSGEQRKISCEELSDDGVGHYVNESGDHVWYHVDTTGESEALLQVGFYENKQQVGWYTTNVDCTGQ